MANQHPTKPDEPAQPPPLVEPWQLEDAVGSYYVAIEALRRRLLAASARIIADEAESRSIAWWLR